MKDLLIKMKNLNIKSPKVILVVSVIGLLFLLTGTSFALFNSTTTSDKKQIVQTGKVKLELTEPAGGLTFDSIDEYSDTDGLLQDIYYDFSIKNIGDAPVSYKLYLLDDADKIADFKGNLLDDKYIRLGLERNNKEIGPMSLYEVNRQIDEYVIGVDKTNLYRLRLWLDFSSATEAELEAMTDNYSKFLKIKVVAEQIFDSESPEVSEIVIEKEDSVALNNTNNSNVMRLSNSSVVANWVEATSIASGDNIRFRIIYTETIMGTAPTLGFKIGDSENNLTEGTISNNEIIYEYTVKDSESGPITIIGLTGGYITDELGNASSNVITHIEVPSIEVEIPAFVPTEGTLAYEILGANNSNVVTSGDGLYVSTETNDGRPTYYYKGDVSNNCISFANQTWRIVRINEDGTIRIMMQWGIDDNTEYMFNPDYNEYKYMYYSESNVTNGAKKILTDWYTTNLSAYDSYIATSTYCEAAKVKYNSSYTSGNATMTPVSSYTPDFRCPEDDGNGYGLITNQKIGLITIDEYFYVGSRENYMENGYGFWTMSPAGFGSPAYMWVVSYSSYIDTMKVANGYNDVIRPVINLNSDILTTQTPFITCPVDYSGSGGGSN